jgi:hypothetical protein
MYRAKFTCLILPKLLRICEKQLYACTGSKFCFWGSILQQLLEFFTEKNVDGNLGKCIYWIIYGWFSSAIHNIVIRNFFIRSSIPQEANSLAGFMEWLRTSWNYSCKVKWRDELNKRMQGVVIIRENKNLGYATLLFFIRL